MMSATAISKQGPDIVGMWGGSYVKSLKDIFLPLNDYFTQEEISAVGGWENSAVDGKYYAAPIRTMITCSFYNKSLFAKAGVDLAKEYDGTYKSFLQICEKLKNAGITPLINGAADGWGMSWLEGTLFASNIDNPEKVINDIVAGTKNFSDTPQLIEAFKAAQDLNKKGYYNNDITTINRPEAVTLFANGKGAIFPSISFDLFDFRAGLKDDLGFMTMPSLSAPGSPNFGAAVGGIGTDAVCVTNYSKYPKEATDFLRFLETYDEEKEFVKDTGELPNVKGDYSSVLSDKIQAEILKISPVRQFPDNLMPANVAETWWKFEPVMLSGQMTVEDFMKEMDKSRDEALASKQ